MKDKIIIADDTKLGGVASTLKSCSATQRDLYRMEKWDEGNLTKYNKEKYEVLHLGRKNPIHQYRLEATKLESSFAENDLEVLMDSKLNMSQQHALMAKNVTRAVLGEVLPAS